MFQWLGVHICAFYIDERGMFAPHAPQRWSAEAPGRNYCFEPPRLLLASGPHRRFSREVLHSYSEGAIVQRVLRM
jgi:hypothetical protein